MSARDDSINHLAGVVRPTDVASASRDPLALAGSELDLVRRAKGGDGHALRALAEGELPRVERLLGRMLGPRPDFEDLVQNVFLELCRALPSFREESRFSTFVGGITVRVARRALRPSAYQRRRAPMPLELVGSEESPEHAASSRERLEGLHRALDALTAKKRIAFTLWALDGMSPEEIAELTDSKPHTVRSRIYHARHELMANPVVRSLLGEP
ncbi:MAG: RNA polymerase sigma factor RpoE [Sandaracinaceae bacterium]|nr:MAG: sigma-70 family RNA polymerase sigma factor [Sandaracinaceae bacterium]HBQ13014.1 RNA polymerase sigma factor [Myxococcales bacterium]